ncbi:MAG TPA: hypothetical protein PK727_01000 [Bacteroidales bacterium]|jgi:hypothetical protein|nr:hypothetical protein [Bacteroidales bacterium]HNY51919.1 hypothetical protein [Bacteroidales bacterium]HOG55885.1 hypothetical protein [Bacteroidales bacterium]HPB12919.1 hypothetical protein [Bacteroidales bacterium]HPX43489.1 hypothetical protein [Bacteroidales bacterium]
MMKKIATFTLILLCFNSINAQRRNDRFLECGIYTLWHDKAKAIECFEKSPSINARAILERIKNPSRNRFTYNFDYTDPTLYAL